MIRGCQNMNLNFTQIFFIQEQNLDQNVNNELKIT